MAKVEQVVGRMKDGKPVVRIVDTKEVVSKENRTEYQNDKRIQELKKRGYGPGQIHAMMDSGSGNFSIKRIEKGLKAKGVKLDGKL